jgi:hypothetical protein
MIEFTIEIAKLRNPSRMAKGRFKKSPHFYELSFKYQKKIKKPFLYGYFSARSTPSLVSGFSIRRVSEVCAKALIEMGDFGGQLSGRRPVSPSS